MNKSDNAAKIGCFLFIFIVFSAILYIVFSTIYENEYNNVYGYKEKQSSYIYDDDFDFVFEKNLEIFNQLELYGVKNIKMRAPTNDDFSFIYSFDIILENQQFPIQIKSSLTNSLERPSIQYHTLNKKIYYPFSYYDLELDIESKKVLVDNVDVNLLNYFSDHPNNYKHFLSDSFNDIIRYIHQEIKNKTIIDFKQNTVLTEYVNKMVESLNKLQTNNVSILYFKYQENKEPLPHYTKQSYCYFYSTEYDTLIKADEFNIADLGEIQSNNDEDFASMYLIYNGKNWVVYIQDKYMNTHRKFYEQIIKNGVGSINKDISFKKAIKESWNLKD